MNGKNFNSKSCTTSVEISLSRLAFAILEIANLLLRFAAFVFSLRLDFKYFFQPHRTIFYSIVDSFRRTNQTKRNTLRIREFKIEEYEDTIRPSRQFF